jgi:spermidine synthase
MEQWLSETHKQTKLSFKVKQSLYSFQSKFQKIEVLDTFANGRIMLLDGIYQFSELDEFVYHEMMAHVPLHILPSAETMLVIGGGDGGVVTEALKHKNIQKIDLVEIDEAVIQVSQKYFPGISAGLGDTRCEILCTDGIAYMQKIRSTYDIIVIDSTDPEGFAQGLFTQPFYRDVCSGLKENGILCFQAGSPWYDQNHLKDIVKHLKPIFPVVTFFTAPVTVYPAGLWCFGFASKGAGPEAVTDKNINGLKYYNLDVHKAGFQLPNFIRKLLL